MNKDSKEIKVPCSKLLKDYNTKHLRSISDMSVNEVFMSLSANGGIITKKCSACNNLISELIQKIGNFKPSSPMTVEEQTKLQNLQTLWLSQLNDLITAISVPIKPTYLRDTVTQRLKAKNSILVCQNIHLEWYLEQHQDSPLDPDKIADAIIEHDSWDWSQVPHLRRNSAYYITADIKDDQVTDSDGTLPKKQSRVKGKYDNILNAIEFIESFPATNDVETLDARLKNDIKIADEVLAWRERDADTYDYRQQFQMFLNRLQTLPDSAKQITFADIDEKAIKKLAKGKPTAKKKAKSQQTKKVCNASTGMSQAETSSMPLQTADGDGQAEPQKEVTPSYGGGAPEPIASETVTIPSRSELDRQSIAQQNHTELTSYLENIAIKSDYLKVNIREERNIGYIQKFANREDFREVFDTLKHHTVNERFVPARTVMQFIRNVANHNILDWGAPAPAQG